MKKDPLYNLEITERAPAPFHEFYVYPPNVKDLRFYERKKVGNILWFGKKGTMYKALPEYTSPREDNIFYPDKLAAVAEAVSSGEPIISYAPPAHLIRISLDEVEGTQRAAQNDRLWEYGIAHAFTTGEPEMDAYLADPERAEEREAPSNSESWHRKMRRHARSLERLKRGDLGKYWVKIRDGNHRIFGAFLGGAPYAWVNVERVSDRD